MSIVVVFTPLQILALVVIALFALAFLGAYVWGWIVGACQAIKKIFKRNRDSEL